MSSTLDGEPATLAAVELVRQPTCPRCGEERRLPGVCPLCEWKLDTERAYTEIERQVGEEHEKQAVAEVLWDRTLLLPDGTLVRRDTR